MILDNDHTEKGAFSIQNVAKMGFCHDKIPGDWYGPHAITVMLRVKIEKIKLTIGLKQALPASEGLPNLPVSRWKYILR
jgi:hypothetical protein